MLCNLADKNNKTYYFSLSVIMDFLFIDDIPSVLTNRGPLYALNTSHLIDTLVTDYIFVSNVVVETLHWEINGFSLGGFVNIEVGLVRISERSQLNYSAFLLYTFNHVTYNENNIGLSCKI